MNLKFAARLLFLLLSFSVFAQDNIYSSYTIPEDLKKNANAVVRNNDIVISLKRRNLMVTTEKRIVTVLNEKGNRHVQAYSGYDKHQKIRKIEAVIYDQNGKEIKKIKKKDFIDQSAVDGGTLYSDSRVLYLSYMPVSYPYTIEFTCETESPNTVFIPSWIPITSYYLSIERDAYTLIDEANLIIKKKTKNFEGYNIKSTTTNSLLSYSLTNNPAVKPEQLSPSLSSIMPNAMVTVERFNCYGIDGQAKNWTEFGDWMHNKLLVGRNTVSNITKHEILNLVDGVEDPIERAKLVYEYVQKNTRYISVQVGIGGNQPIPASEVDRLKYGDCKGLTNYTQALMEIANVSSFYTVVEAGNEIVDFDPEFPSMYQGNHIILAIQDKDNLVWVDCTSQVHPFGFVGDFTDDRNVLMVKENGSKIVKTPSYNNEYNNRETKANINLLADGSFSSEVEVKSKGIQYDNKFFLEDYDKKDVEEYYKNYWGYINDLGINSYNFNNDRSKVEFTEKLELGAHKYATINNDGIIFKPNFFSKNSFVPDRYRNRKHPLNISRGYLHEDTFNIVIPDGYTVEGIPENVSIKNNYGEYEITFKLEDDKIIYNRTLFIKKGLYNKDEYDVYRKFRRSVSKHDNSIIVLKK